ncbi:MAG TPA: hypothetical protein VHG71_05045 [Verrucomicrobiae bacterium]|nr:hypothetical protein [Verrucomicrobiae bacterium]
MKVNPRKRSIFTTSAAIALVSLAGISNVWADYDFATFDTDISANDSTAGSLAATATTAWDGSVNGPNDPSISSGSEYVTVPFTGAGGWQELQLNFTQGSPLDMDPYLNVELDLKVDTANSQLASDGTYGAIYPVLQNWDGSGSPSWAQLPALIITNSADWQHMKFSTASFSGSINRFVLDINNGNSAVVNTVAFWVDDIVFTSPPLPPPTLAKPTSAPKQKGLMLLPASGSQYQRVMVYPNATALGAAFGWYNQASSGNPVSYSFTITNFPGVGNYTAQIFWIPNNAMVYGDNDTSIDWNCTNDLVLTISATSTNPATGWGVTMAAKTNSPGALGNGNPNLTITNFPYASLPVGTWTVTFNNNTDFTITAPDSTSVSASLPSDVADIVSGNAAGSSAATVFFGIQPNSTNGIGLPTVMSNIKVSGTPQVINDNFNLGYLDTTNVWSTLTDVQGDITVNNGDLAWYLTWNTPNDQGYSALQGAASISGPWHDLVPNGQWLLVNGTRTAAVKTTDLASIGATNSSFFRLIKRQFSQLQVLLPGETNAPGTVTGKVGTPDPISLGDGGLVTVTVNACDSAWNIVNASDTVQIDTTDGNAILPSPSGLSHGTAQMAVEFVDTGSFTVTATDNTNPSITSGTSSPITVNP